jgi:hypothetical protein
MDADLD